MVERRTGARAAPGTSVLPHEVKVINYDMCSYVEQSLESYEELVGDKFRPYRKSSTPFVADDDEWPEDDKEGGIGSDRVKGRDESAVLCQVC